MDIEQYMSAEMGPKSSKVIQVFLYTEGARHWYSRPAILSWISLTNEANDIQEILFPKFKRTVEMISRDMTSMWQVITRGPVEPSNGL